MAIVYLAEDVRHRRKVALKVLRPEVGRELGGERFLREIEIAARLSHPRIVPLIDSGVADGLLFYAMPHIDGESLRERLDREKQLPVQDALEIARQAAAAIAHAHDHGVVHRDIKPSNILLIDGEALISDFGIARAVSAAGGTRFTETGVAVGTAAYMSPEQASGDSEVDGRTDVYGLGCVLYEMLAGEVPFTGVTVQAITARKLTESPPDVTVVRDTVPSSVADTLRKALARVPADRFSNARQFADALPRTVGTTLASSSMMATPTPSRLRGSFVALAGLAATLLVVAVWSWLRPDGMPDPEPVRFSVPLPSAALRGGVVDALALSPDGRTLVAAGGGEDERQLYQRALDGLEVTPIAGTVRAQSPFFSPDGRWIGFYADGWMRRIPAEGGAPVDVVRLPRVPVGATWGVGDRIVFAPDNISPLYIVDARGGSVEPITVLDTVAGETSHVAPEFLPSGRAILFEASGGPGGRSRIFALDLVSGRRVALTDGRAPQYAASGHLIVRRGGALLAAPFDPDRLELGGSVAPLVASDLNIADYAISRSGTLAFVSGSEEYRLVLVDADGQERLVTPERLMYSNPRFSPDGRSIAVATRRATGDDIWIHDLETGSATRLTLEGGRSPVWTPDGRAVTFASIGRGVFSQRVDGSGEPRQLLALDAYHWLVGWTSDGRTLGVGVTDQGILAVTDGEPDVVLPGSIWGGRLSPDGSWLAYYSLESGQFDVWVTRFPPGGTRWQITTDGGGDPSWAPSGLELYYRNGNRLMAAQIDTTAGVRVRSRRVALEPFEPPQYDDFDIHPNLRTLVVVQPVPESQRRDVVVVVNWFTELRRSVGS